MSMRLQALCIGKLCSDMPESRYRGLTREVKAIRGTLVALLKLVWLQELSQHLLTAIRYQRHKIRMSVAKNNLTSARHQPATRAKWALRLGKPPKLQIPFVGTYILVANLNLEQKPRIRTFKHFESFRNSGRRWQTISRASSIGRMGLVHTMLGIFRKVDFLVLFVNSRAWKYPWEFRFQGKKSSCTLFALCPYCSNWVSLYICFGFF